MLDQSRLHNVDKFLSTQISSRGLYTVHRTEENNGFHTTTLIDIISV